MQGVTDNIGIRRAEISVCTGQLETMKLFRIQHHAWWFSNCF